MSEAPLRATLKAGAGYDAPWLGVDGTTPEELVERLNAIANGGVSEALVNAANILKGVNSAAPIAAEVASPPAGQPVLTASAQQQAWGSQAPAPSWATGQPQAAPAQPAVQTHPEGIQCPVDGNVVQFKEITAKTGKKFQLWSCPNQRSRGDGHYSEFAN